MDCFIAWVKEAINKWLDHVILVESFTSYKNVQ